MGKVAILTDSNSGITQEEAKKLGIYVFPTPVYIDDEVFYEARGFNNRAVFCQTGGSVLKLRLLCRLWEM